MTAPTGGSPTATRDRICRPYRAPGPARFGDEVETHAYNLAGNGKSQILGTTGFVKVVRLSEGPVVGVLMIGSRMGEQVGEAALWVNREAAFPEDAARFIHAHPTQNEALGEAALALTGQPLPSMPPWLIGPRHHVWRSMAPPTWCSGPPVVATGGGQVQVNPCQDGIGFARTQSSTANGSSASSSLGVDKVVSM